MSISQFIYSWLKDLVILFIIISLLDLVMPKGSMKKYINFVIGLLIIFTVINPFINIGRVKFDLDKEVLKNLEGNISTYGEQTIVNEQEKQIEKIYKEKLSGEITEIVEENTEYTVFDIDIYMETSKDEFGMITGIDIVLSKDNINTKEKGINIEIQPVTILEKQTESKNTESFYELKTLVGKNLNIEIDSINLSINEQGG